MTRPDARAFAAPNPTPVLFFVGATLALLWAVEYGEASFWIAAAIVVPFLLFQFARHEMLAAASLMVATAVGRFYLEISGLKAYPEYLAVGVLALVVPFWLKRSSFRPTWIVADFLLLAYLACNLFSSALTSPEPRQTLRWALLQLIVIAPYFLLRLVAVERAAFTKLLNILLAVGTLEAVYTVACFFSSILFGTKVGMEQEQYGSIAAPYGTLREPNLVGSYAAACMIMLLVVYFAKPGRKVLAAVAVTAAATMVSLARAAVAAALIALIVTFIYGIKSKQVGKRTILKAGVAVLGAWLAVAPAIVSLYQERLKTVSVTDVSEDDTIGGRLLINALALQDILENPFFGTGTASFQLAEGAQQLGDDPTLLWIGNTELRIMHDTGSLGLAVFVSFLFFLLKGAVTVLKREAQPELLALLLSGIVYSIAFQATEGTLLAFAWVHFGLIGCALALFRSSLATNAPEKETSR
ncbi:MAG TPA: O-antigen ligase family protein [Candidatus Angelobacter sp.]